MQNAGDDDLIPLVEERPQERPQAASGKGSWKVLIVDDEPEVHQATTFALAGFSVAGRPLEFLHAYSATQCREVLEATTDVAVALLDVVMETEDAGLKLVRTIRDDLLLGALRIVLRTGQPGYAPELKVIQDYDINDYKTKSELTRTRLATTVTSAIRSYEQIRTIESNRNGLDLIVRASADLFTRRDMHAFCEGVLKQLCALLGLPPEGLVSTRVAGPGTSGECVVVGAAGRFLEVLGKPLAALGNERIERAIRRTIEARRHLGEDGFTTLYLPGHLGHEVAVFVEASNPAGSVEAQLIEVFAGNISSGFENVSLIERLHQAAYYDVLCGLPNRNKFVAEIDAQAARTREGWVVGILDVDHFSETNDALGHERGDMLLRAIGGHLRTALPREVVVARIAADLFGVFGTEENLEPEKLTALFAKPFAVDEYQLQVSVSLGLARLADSDGGVDALKNANLGLKRAQQRGRARYDWYTRAMEDETRERVRLAHDLRRGIEASELMMYYQPQIDLKTDRPIGAEVLLRWKTADGRFVPPDKFIPVAEHSGLIQPIGDWVLRSACRQLRAWKDGGLAGFRLAVNVSMIQFRSDGFADRVGGLIQENGIDPSTLELEITESMAMDEVQVVMKTLQQLSALGITVAIDDFGTGFSSLGYLQQLAVDRLKIDKRFVNELSRSSGRASIAETIIRLGRNLGLEVVAEGVETQDQAARLCELGCDIGQGYLYQRPVDLKAFETWLAERGVLRAAAAA